MSDYLSNLLDRSLKPEQAIQPRLASLFEPLSADSSQALLHLASLKQSDIETSFDETESGSARRSRPVGTQANQSYDLRPPVENAARRHVEDDFKSDSLKPNLRTQSRLPSQPPPDLPTQSSKRKSHSTNNQQPQDSADFAPLETDVKPSDPDVETLVGNRAPARARAEKLKQPALNSTEIQPSAPVELSQTSSSKMPETPAPRPFYSDAPAAQPGAVESAALSLRIESDAPSGRLATLYQPADLIEPEIHYVERVILEQPAPQAISQAEQAANPNTVPRASRPVETTVIARLGAPPQVKEPAWAGEIKPPEQAQTIQVTIGRIEVRATPPAPPSRKERPMPQGVSLDEYLRQRAKGDGR